MMRFDIRRLETTASTNDDAKQAAENGAAEGLVVWALRQSAGRGRQGRVWESPEGNLYCSVLLHPPAPVREWGRYSFVAALALYEAVEFYVNGSTRLPSALRGGIGEGGGSAQAAVEMIKIAPSRTPPPPTPSLKGRGILSAKPVELKWPNDILVDGKKISGILLESGEGWLVVGMGLNVRHVPENPLYPVTCLAAETGDVPSLEEILTKILESLAAWYQLINTEGFASLRAAWLAHARKGVLRVRLPQEEIQGQFVDLDRDGNLRLLLADGRERTISAGDVFF
ncbi:MAG: biotin--[acetyl-CoA-carboxylase] ligase [Alphaproteobacteria bacterium]|nr:biotin--[acetyl-CoA-carboxylase] ligase [Alphaproteobacteria bacterium]